MAVTLVLEEVVQRLRAAGLVMDLQYDPSTGPFPPSHSGTRVEASDASYVDDDLFLNMTGSADDAANTLRQMAEIVYEVFWLHGLTVNFEPGNKRREH